MISAQTAIARLRWDLAISTLLHRMLIGAALLTMFADAVFGDRFFRGSLLLAVIGTVWLVLMFRSVKGSQIAAASPMLIAAGQWDQAEQVIDQALRGFSLIRVVKLRALHHLAMLRHAQRQWAETAVLCQALLEQKLAAATGLSRSARLMLANALLEAGDLAGTYHALVALYQQRLSLNEALQLTSIQADYLARVQAWESLAEGIEKKVELAELMPPEPSARTQALLALAAKHVGRGDWERYLRRRVELLADVKELVAHRPELGSLWA